MMRPDISFIYDLSRLRAALINSGFPKTSSCLISLSRLLNNHWNLTLCRYKKAVFLSKVVIALLSVRGALVLHGSIVD